MSNQLSKDENNAPTSNEMPIVDENTLRDKIYFVRGVPVMLDTDLAEIYGYTHKGFNKQVKNNEEKFDRDFRFELTKEEVEDLRRKNYAANISTKSRSLPYVYTEQGIYMLMTVLKGDLAVKQSKSLIRMFKSMKDFITDSPSVLTNQQLLALSYQTTENTLSIRRIEENMVSHAELSNFIKLFDQDIQNEEILILNGEPFKADVAYQKIYRSAKKSIIVIDDYIGVKTLYHLVHAKSGVKLTIISDNKLRILKLAEYNDFLTEYPSKVIDFIKSQGMTHDRYIIIDNETADMKIYHCGASSKDAGKRITTITRLSDVKAYKEMINTLLSNNSLILK